MVLVGIVAVFVVLLTNQSTVAPGSGAQSSYPSNGFGGYQLDQPVREISARFHVPAIASSSSGDASTWVGADDANFNHFIQLGVTEDQYGPGLAVYEAFWSDTSVGFHPQSLGAVHAGDLVQVQMVHNATGWSMRFRDFSGHRFTVTQQIHYAVGVAFEHGDFQQEDPSSGDVSATDLPYPAMSVVTFTALKINDRAPRVREINGGVLLANGGVILVPTPVRHDSFSYVTPSGESLRYLRAEAARDGADALFNARFVTWNKLTPQRRSAYALDLARAYRRFAMRLSAESWSANVHASVDALVLSVEREARDVTSWSRSGGDTGDGSFQLATLQREHTLNLEDQTRHRLALPPTE